MHHTESLAEADGQINEFGQYSFEDNWGVLNCAEVSSVRQAILNGADYDNIEFKCVDINTGLYQKPCHNCSETFKFLKNLGDE